MSDEIGTPASGEILVRFTTEDESAGASSLEPPLGEDAVQQAFWPFKRRSVKDVPMKVASLSSQINDIAATVQGALSAPQPASGGFHVDSFEIGLAINASGHVVLIAEVGIEASITVTFKRT
jgi:hypothetical protein